MDANQRSEVNNQTNNGANEKWTPGSKGNTTSGPMDHTYPKGPSQQQAIRGDNDMGGQDPSRMGQQEVAAEDGSRAGNETTLAGAVQSDLPGGSMQSQQTGGTGPQQGITDSHQRQMEQRSGAWGMLEQPVGHRDKHSGTNLMAHPANQQGNSQAAHAMNPQDPAQPELQGGSLGRHHDAAPGTYQTQAATGQGGFYSNQQTAMHGGEGTGMATPYQQGNAQQGNAQQGNAQQGNAQQGNAQQGNAQQGNAQQGSDQGNAQKSTDRGGSQTGTGARDTGSHDVHQSNDVAGGLPRSPGNSGPTSDNPGWLPAQSVDAEKNPVRDSNDLGGGLPKSPAGANQLAGDRKMDDDTGFSRG